MKSSQLFLAIAATAIARATETPSAPPRVVWDSPSADARGSMPLGNGDIALNATAAC